MRRKISYSILNDVLIKGKHAHLVLKTFDLDPQDQAFVSALVYATLQHKMYLEYQFEDYIDKKTPQTVRIVLLLAACQRYKMRDIPDYAIVNESVNLVKQVGLSRYSGLVNAVLKKMLKRDERAYPEDALERASIEFSMPLWILKLLKGQYNLEFALDYALYCQSVKPTYGWINELKASDIDALKEYFVSGTCEVKSSLFQTSYLDDARVVIQDINSKAVVDSIPLSPGMRVLDCCCAPGTKTLGIANKLKNTGEIIGVDLHANRVLKTQDLMNRGGVSIATIQEADATLVSFDKTFDVVLVDAPCSGLGVISHKHDLRYHIHPEDLDALQSIQADILDNVSQYVSDNGMLVYATCTLNRKENEKQVSAFLTRNPNFKLVYEHTFNPMDTRGDGFYVAHCVQA